MSAASSGGVRSSVILTASTIELTVSASASRISSELTSIVLGTPASKSRPLTSIVVSRPEGYALPIVLLMTSAVRSPIARLYLRRM